MIYRHLAVLVAALCLAGPAAADWTYRAPQGAGDLGDARVNEDSRMLSVGCGRDNLVTLAVVPGVERLGSTPTEVRVGFVIDNNPATRIDVPMVCSASHCVRGEVPGRGVEDEATALVANLQRGLSLQLYFRDRQVGDVTLRGSSAAIQRLRAAAPNCVGL